MLCVVAYDLQALGTFGLCQLYAFFEYVKSKVSQQNFEVLFKAAVTALVVVLGVAALILTISGKQPNLT